MPNKDGGHYFLTCLIPVLRGAEFDAAGDVMAPTRRLREILALTPVRGVDGPGAGKLLAGNAPTEGYQGPFARNLRNHFVRLAVIEDINDNGRMNGDGLLEAIGRVDPIKPQWVDHLSRPYLLFTADFDSPADGPQEPDSYLRLLWRTCEQELRQIFTYCYGFEGVNDAEAFVRYIKGCQVETSMPFNDYWPDAFRCRLSRSCPSAPWPPWWAWRRASSSAWSHGRRGPSYRSSSGWCWEASWPCSSWSMRSAGGPRARSPWPRTRTCRPSSNPSTCSGCSWNSPRPARG